MNETVRKIASHIGSGDNERVPVRCRTCGRPAWGPRFLIGMRCRIHPTGEMVPVEDLGMCDACEADSNDAALRAAMPRVDKEALLSASGIPVTDEVRLDEAVYRWLTKPTGGLVLSGPTRAGKTTQSCELGRRWIREREQSVIYRTEVKLLAALRDVERGAHMREMALLTSCDLLIIDDIGVAKSSDWTHALMFEVISARHQNKQPIVITTNLAVAGVQATFWTRPGTDDRIMRRLSEMCTPITMARRP